MTISKSFTSIKIWGSVKEYRIVDPKRKIITVNYFKADTASVQYPFSSVVKVNIYDDLYVDFSEIEQLFELQ